MIIDACVRIADTEGPEAVTLRRLGRELGVDATAMYRHFRDKDELLTAAADRLLVEALDGLEATGSLRDAFHSIATHVRRVYLAHPGLVGLLATAPGPLPSEARATEAGLAILRSAGLSLPEAVAAFEVLQDHLLAITALDAVRRGQSGDAWRAPFTGLSRDEYPNLAEAAPYLYGDLDARFHLGLDLLLEAIEARHAARA